MTRWLGWALLAGVAAFWSALTVWAATDPCTFDCSDFGRGRGAFALWVLSLAAVPAGAWLLKISYRRTNDTFTRSLPATLAAKLLYIFSATMLLIAAFATFQLLKNLTGLATGCCSYRPIEDARSSWISGAVFSGFGLGWFGLIGATTLSAVRWLGRAVDAKPSQVLLWIAAIGLAIAGLAGVLVSQFLFT